ncbi:RraA family protein [Billgrantia aerodenitrificans]|uniref:Putative 4-hydroxy-4-methyl-2-oxoglutarate aldolase n=1 Tax=Billgrantia aerodenitrificans TaxID=2733483 RepID=A0ABS9AN90_9GAMM|nr:RraA family protein [Halomonas aerodenitrificans]MCE8023204.1 RraA family protein [Halomonas aerodenitrificans]
MPYVTDAGLSEAFKYVGSAVLSDVLDETGFPSQVIKSGLLALGSSEAFCGPAVCVQGGARPFLQTQVPAGFFQGPYELTNIDTCDSVLVLSAQGFTSGALLGDRIAGRLKQNGCLGFITDGYARDSQALAEIGLPVRAAGLTPVNGGKRWAIFEKSITVTLPAQAGGVVKIRPGDFVLADQDGVVIVPKEHAQDLISMAEEYKLKEERLKENDGAVNLSDLTSHLRWLRT